MLNINCDKNQNTHFKHLIKTLYTIQFNINFIKYYTIELKFNFSLFGKLLNNVNRIILYNHPSK